MTKIGGTLVCAWVCRLAHDRDVAMREPALLAAKSEFYAKYSQDGDYVKIGRAWESHSRNEPHELPANMPVMLKRVTGVDAVKMVGVEGVLAGGLDKLVNDLVGDEFEAWVNKCMQIGHDESSWMISDHISGIAEKPLVA